MWWKFRVWLGAKVLTWGMNIAGLTKNSKWQAIQLMGEIPEVKPITNEIERLNEENLTLRSLLCRWLEWLKRSGPEGSNQWEKFDSIRRDTESVLDA